MAADLQNAGNKIHASLQKNIHQRDMQTKLERCGGIDLDRQKETENRDSFQNIEKKFQRIRQNADKRQMLFKQALDAHREESIAMQKELDEIKREFNTFKRDVQAINDKLTDFECKQ